MRCCCPLSRLALTLVLTCVPALAAAQSVRAIPLVSNDLIFDPLRQVIYASVPSSVGVGGNTVTVINPATGAVGPSVFVGSEPGPLALSDNGQYLYVGLNGAPAVRRVDLQTFTATQQFSLGSDPSFGPYYAEDLEVAPGQPLVVAVSLRRLDVSPRHGGVAIFDNGVARAAKTQDHTGSNVIEFGATADRIYGYCNESSEFGFRRLNVTAGGVFEQDVTRDLFSRYGADMVFDGGRIYATTGAVVEPEARTVLGTFTGVGPNGSALVRPAADRGVVYFLSGSVLRVYDAATFVPLQPAFTVPGVTGDTGALIRVGATGLAFRTSGGQLFLLDVPVSPPPPPPPPAMVGVALTATGCTTCAAGATFAVAGLVTNAWTSPVRVEVKAGFGLPDGREVPMSLLGQSHFEIALPPGLSANVEFVRLVFPPGLPRGTWTYEVSVLSPDLGRSYAHSTVTFTVP